MPLRFTRKFVSAETFEAAAVFDVDGDGVPDIVTGGYWYKGPDFRQKFIIAARLPRYRGYYDEFSVIPMDIAGNGRLDFITGGWWGENLRWRKNPGPQEFGWGMAPWEEHVLAANIGNVETTRAWDIDGDGRLEIVPNTPGSRSAPTNPRAPANLKSTWSPVARSVTASASETWTATASASS